MWWRLSMMLFWASFSGVRLPAFGSLPGGVGTLLCAVLLGHLPLVGCMVLRRGGVGSRRLGGVGSLYLGGVVECRRDLTCLRGLGGVVDRRRGELSHLARGGVVLRLDGGDLDRIPCVPLLVSRICSLRLSLPSVLIHLSSFSMALFSCILLNASVPLRGSLPSRAL